MFSGAVQGPMGVILGGFARDLANASADCPAMAGPVMAQD
jgi:hypothetical protein